MITHIVNSAQCNRLEDSGAVPSPLLGTKPHTQAMRVPVQGIAGAESGLWECTVGSWRRATPNAEIMHFVAGDCTFTPDGQAPLRIRAGDTVVFPVNTEGTWVVHETVRKVYVTLKCP